MITLKLLAVPLSIQHGEPLACFPGGAPHGLMLSSRSAWPARPFQLSCLQPGSAQPALPQGLCSPACRAWPFSSSILIKPLPVQSSSLCGSIWLEALPSSSQGSSQFGVICRLDVYNPYSEATALTIL